MLHILSRFALRSGIYALWLIFRKGVVPAKATYFAVMCWSCFTMENNIFMTPQLAILRWEQFTLTPSPLLDALLAKLLELLLEFLFLTLASRTLFLNESRTVDAPRIGVLCCISACELYIKHTLKLLSVTPTDTLHWEFTSYPILLQVLLLAALLFSERYFVSREQRERERLQDLSARYHYENTRVKAEAALDVRQLHHDLKNHLLTLQTLSGDDARLGAYIGQLLQRVEPYECLADTGNTLLDGLLTEKMQQARTMGVDLEVFVDFRAGGFLADMDICTIFGNALDNMLEAAVQLPEPDDRTALVRGECTAGVLHLLFRNRFSGDLAWQQGRPMSRKGGPDHGLGLSSIQAAAAKYDGAMTCFAEDGVFSLSVLLPVPAEVFVGSSAPE